MQENEFENNECKMAAILSEPHGVNFYLFYFRWVSDTSGKLDFMVNPELFSLKRCCLISIGIPIESVKD